MVKTSVSGTPSALAFSRSTLTKSCGVPARKLLNRPTRPGVWLPLRTTASVRSWPKLAVAGSGKVADHQLEAALAAQAVHGGGGNVATRAS